MKNLQQLQLKNHRLLIELEGPGDLNGGSRFDRLGRVTQVTLDGRTRFCTVESEVQGEGTGGAGLCSEFGISTPVGYGDARTGEYFPKLGVGLLRKPDEEPYAFYRPYEVEPLVVKETIGRDFIRFSAEMPPCRGYSAFQERIVKIEENRLHLQCYLKNTGEREIVTEEYCHNFISVNGSRTGPGYRLELAGNVSFGQAAEVVILSGNRATFPQTLQEPFYCRFLGVEAGKEYTWRLTGSTEGAGVSEANDFIPSKFALWGSGHVLSPEVFIEIRLQPGEELRWTRSYEFFRQKQ